MSDANPLSSKDNAALRSWLSPEYLMHDFILKKSHIFLRQKPFPHLVLKNFFRKEKVLALTRALSREQFYLKYADLFTFFQTNDLVSSQNRTIVEFRHFLSSSAFVSFISGITALPLASQKIDLAGTRYTATHHLLPHDDHLEKRRVAFMLYLSTLAKKDGGAFGMYASRGGKATRIIKRIQPEINTFVFFTVCPTSFHEVEEVLTNKKRIALSGWFYDQ